MNETFPLPNVSVDLTGEVALVTGASPGLGRRFAQVLAAAGASVVAASRRTDRLEELANEIRSGGGACEPVKLDVTTSDELVAVIDRAEEAFGTVTILVNNAGITEPQRAHTMSRELVDRLLDTNLRAPWILACEVAGRLIAAERTGRIVNVSSILAFHYAGGGALYATTKAAINRMTETLAVEWARYGINVNAIAPGAFVSEMTDGLLRRIGDISTTVPRRRLGQPSQLDSTLLYLVAPSSDCVTGTVVKVDDGQTPP